MEVLHSKSISSRKLKYNFDKQSSIVKAAEFSQNINSSSHPRTECPICAEKKSVHVANIYGFEYKECCNCGVLFTGNPPTEANLASAYQSEYYTASNKILYANDNVIEYRLNEIAKPKVDFITKRATAKKKTWLDIGCGAGEILAEAKKNGFEVLGLDANSMQIDYAKSQFGIDVRQEYLSSKNARQFANHFGIVSLFSVLEHVLFPNEILKQVSSIQEIGDNVVVEVPHYPSLSAYSQITFPEHVNRMMHPPLHLFLFSIKSLEIMLKAHGYTIKTLWLFGQDIYEVFSTLGIFAKNFTGSALQNKLYELENELQHVVDSNGLSDEVLLIAEKSAISLGE